MTIIETSVVVIAAVEVGRCGMDIAKTVQTMLLLKRGEREFNKLKDGLNFGAQLGAMLGGALGAGVDWLAGDKTVSLTNLRARMPNFMEVLKRAQPNSGNDADGKNNPGPRPGA